MENTIITTTICPIEERLNFLPKHTGYYFMQYESMVYDYMNAACNEYNGGLWGFYTLSNGGFLSRLKAKIP